MGSGGRSITGGVVYRKPDTAGESRLPDEWEGAYLFGEWMRNWVAAARFDEAGKLVKAERVLESLTFQATRRFQDRARRCALYRGVRRPMDGQYGKPDYARDLPPRESPATGGAESRTARPASCRWRWLSMQRLRTIRMAGN